MKSLLRSHGNDWKRMFDNITTRRDPHLSPEELQREIERTGLFPTSAELRFLFDKIRLGSPRITRDIFVRWAGSFDGASKKEPIYLSKKTA